MYHLPFPSADFQSVSEIMQIADVDKNNTSEILDIVDVLLEYGIIESI